MSNNTIPIPSTNTPSFSDTYGSGLIGSWLAMGLYGLTTTQAYLYWVNYPKDSKWIKLLVVFLWVLNTAHSIAVCHISYHYLVIEMADIGMLLRSVWSLSMSVVIYLVVVVTVMFYYMSVIFQLSRKQWRWWLTGAVAVPVLLFAAYALDVSIRMILLSDLLGLLEFVHSAILPCFILQVVADGSISASLCILLYVKRTDFQRTRHVINALIIYAASRGLVTLLVTLIMVLALAISPYQLWFTAAEYAIVGLYTNSLMTMLNARSPSCETAINGSADGTNKNYFGSSDGRNHNGMCIENRAPNIEFIALGAKGTSYKDGSQCENKPVV